MTLPSGAIRLPAASSRDWSVRSLNGRIVVYTDTRESHLVKRVLIPQLLRPNSLTA